MIINATLAEVAHCRRAGIIVNTFMLTDDYYLVEFVKKMTEIAHGKAYFTTSLSLGEYVMMDFVKRKTSGLNDFRFLTPATIIKAAPQS